MYKIRQKITIALYLFLQKMYKNLHARLQHATTRGSGGLLKNSNRNNSAKRLLEIDNDLMMGSGPHFTGLQLNFNDLSKRNDSRQAEKVRNQQQRAKAYNMGQTGLLETMANNKNYSPPKGLMKDLEKIKWAPITEHSDVKADFYADRKLTRNNQRISAIENTVKKMKKHAIHVPTQYNKRTSGTWGKEQFQYVKDKQRAMDSTKGLDSVEYTGSTAFREKLKKKL